MTDTPGRPSLRKGGTPSDPPATPPRFVLYTVVALIVSGVMSVLGALSLQLSSVKDQVRDRFRDSYSDTLVDKLDDARKAGPSSGSRGTQLDSLREQFKALKDTASDRLSAKLEPLYTSVQQLKPGASAKGKPLFDDLKSTLDDVKKLSDTVAAQQKGVLLSSAVVLIALGIAAAAAYKGKYWARWAVLGVWVLSSITGATLVGIGSLLSIGADLSPLFKGPAFLAALALIVAVVLINLRPSTEFLNRSRPVRAVRGGGQRRGLFSPRPPAGPRTPAAEPKASSSAPDRARTKQRASDNAAAAAKGAELARRRAKAAKSRRSGS